MSKKVNIECDCVIAGGGASGMMAAIWAAKSGAEVILIEHTKRLGTKILQTGNGKCNFTNLNIDETKYQNEDTNFVKNVIEQFDVNKTIEFFQSIGVYHKEKNGYVYPNSETAASLQDALRMKVISEHVRIFEMCEITQINNQCSSSERFVINAEQFSAIDDTAEKGKKKKNKEEQIVKTAEYIIKAKSLILATGSKAAPKTGSDGSGYTFAKKLGHTIVKPLPALVQLESQDKLCKSMSGVRSTGKAVLYADGKELAHDTGEIQYTDYGISGIPIFQISRYAVKAVDNKQKVNVVIDMLPDFTEDELCMDMSERMAIDKNKTLEQFFSGLINKKLVYAASKRAGADINEKVGRTEKIVFKDMIHIFKHFSIEINGFKDFMNGQICQGGVSLSEIDDKTMQSRIVEGLFFAGELTDVDGKCGGYNLQWAWSSGYLAGVSAANSKN